MENNSKLFSLTKSLDRETVSYFYDKPPLNRTKINRIKYNLEDEVKRWNKCDIIELEEEVIEVKKKKVKLEDVIIDPLMILEANSIFNEEEKKKLKSNQKENQVQVQIKEKQKEEHFIPTGPSTSRLESTFGSNSKPITISRKAIILEPDSLSSSLPKGRNGGGDRNHLLKSLSKRDYEPYLSKEMVELEWYKPYMSKF